MPVRPVRVLLSLLLTSGVAYGQMQVYQPLGTWVSPEATWGLNLQNVSERTQNETPRSTRPELAGLRPRSVELLEDAFLRKHPRLLQDNPERARELILRRYNSAEGPLRGYMAEAMFVDRNPEWQYVRQPNATQHDVYRWVDGQRPPYTGQIKYHDSGTPSLYARDMILDHRSPRFFVPDDHVEPTKAYLRGRAESAQRGGDVLEAKRLWHDYSRVRPIGATSAEIRSATTEAARFVAREKYSVYTSLGAASALAFAPILIELANGDTTANLATYQAARSLSLLGVWYGTNQGLARFRNGALRGGVRGNVIVGTALVLTETIWLLQQHGWQKAFYQPEFYEKAVGGVSATGLALAGGLYGTSLASGTGPWAPVIGTGTALVLGTVGYVGGETAAHEIVEIVAPEALRRQERQMIANTKATIDHSIAELQGLH